MFFSRNLRYFFLKFFGKWLGKTLLSKLRGGVGGALWFGATPELRLWGSPEAEVWEPFQPPVMPEAALEK